MIPYPRLALLGGLLAAILLHAPAIAATIPFAPAAAILPKPATEPAARGEARFSPAIVYQDQVLSEDTVWRGEVLIEGAVTIAPQATLSIEPGTVVRFRRRSSQLPLLLVQGRMVAAGTKETPILFTSTFAVPAAADWQGVMLLGSEKKNILENCRIEGAQTGIEAFFSSVTLKNVRVERAATGMRFQDTLVAMEAGGAFDCDLGLSLSDSEATLRSVSIEGNRRGVLAIRSSLYLLEGNISGNKGALSGDGCRLKIQGATVLGNGSGLTLSGCEGAVTGAMLVGNKEYGLLLTASRLRVSANQISDNGGDGLIVYDGAAVAWDNAIFGNAGYDLYNAGAEAFKAPGNWWGPTAPRIFDNGGRGKVLFTPLRASRPSSTQLPASR